MGRLILNNKNCKKMGLLKASTNRVRTSEALRMNSMWENTIGLQNEHNNAAVEDRLNEGLLAHVRGSKRKHDHITASKNILRTSTFSTTHTDPERILRSLKQQNMNSSRLTRGICRRCGETGHLTKDCRNYLANYFEAKHKIQKNLAGISSKPTTCIEESDLSSVSTDYESNNLRHVKTKSFENNSSAKKRKTKIKDKRNYGK